MAWEEWEQIKADVATRHTVQVRLNQLPAAEGGGCTPNLASSPAEKQAAAKVINDDLEPGVGIDGKHAAESVKAAVKEFGARDGYGWDTSGALKKAHTTWEQQVKALLSRLASEKLALGKTGIDFQSNDLDIATQLTPYSRIDNC